MNTVNTMVPVLLGATADCASYCRYTSASSLKYIPDCAGCSGSVASPEPSSGSSSCEDWCSNVPSRFWKENPPCAGCHGSGAASSTLGSSVALTFTLLVAMQHFNML